MKGETDFSYAYFYAQNKINYLKFNFHCVIQSKGKKT